MLYHSNFYIDINSCIFFTHFYLFYTFICLLLFKKLLIIVLSIICKSLCCCRKELYVCKRAIFNIVDCIHTSCCIIKQNTKQFSASVKHN